MDMNNLRDLNMIDEREVDRLNEQYSEMHQRRKKILAAETDAPFDCD